MIAANVLSKEEFPDFDEETGILPKVDDEEGMQELLLLSLRENGFRAHSHVLFLSAITIYVHSLCFTFFNCPSQMRTWRLNWWKRSHLS